MNNRKQLATELGQELGVEVEYLGVPSCAYRVGGYTIKKDGTIEGDLEAIKDFLIRHNYFHIEPHTDAEDTIRLTVGRAGSDTWLSDRWDGTIWNNRLEPLFQIEWAWITDRSRGDWYTDMEEARRISALRWKRYKTQHTDEYVSEDLGTAYKSAALSWVKRQPRLKTCKLEDITAIRRVRRVYHDGKTGRYFEIEARGQKLTLGR